MFEEFLVELRQHNKIDIKYKDESLLMKNLNKVVGIFAKDFMTKFTTTIGSTVYFPSRKFVKENEFVSVQILAHEYVHILDSKKHKSFSISYLFPQILALLSLLTIPVVLIYGSIGWLFLLFLIMLAPFPAYWRMKWEARGYEMSIFVIYNILKKRTLETDSRKNFIENTLNVVAEDINEKSFEGWSYYKMWPWGIQGRLSNQISKFISGDISETDEAYKHVQDALDKVL